MIPQLRSEPPWLRDPLWRKAKAVPSLDLDFSESGSLRDKVSGQELVTFTRASDATYVDSQGIIRTVTTNVPRLTWENGRPLGLLVEEARTNSIRNNTMVGAVAGTPGTLPTNWAVSSLGTLARQVVGVGIDKGITYVDLRLSGTTSTTFTNIVFESSSALAASNGQSWVASVYLALVAGGITNVSSVRLLCALYSSAPAYLGELVLSPPDLKAGLTESLLRQPSAAGTIANASAASIQPYIQLTFPSGVAIDITLRIGLPQLELGAFATSPILTSGLAATRAADVATITGTNFSRWYRQDEGTLFMQWVRNTTISSAGRVALMTDGTANNRTFDCRQDNASSITSIIVNSTNLEAAIVGSLNATTGVNSLAFAAAANNAAASANGAAAVTDTTVVVPTVNRLEIGSFSGTSFINGTISRLTYWPRRLPDSVLQELTR